MYWEDSYEWEEGGEGARMRRDEHDLSEQAGSQKRV